MSTPVSFGSTSHPSGARWQTWLCVSAQYLGGSTTGERGEKLFQELCNLWPPGSVSADALRKVLDDSMPAAAGSAGNDSVPVISGLPCLRSMMSRPRTIGSVQCCRLGCPCEPHRVTGHVQVYTNRKRAQTKAVNQARKEQEAAANAGQQQPGQSPASDAPPATMASQPGAASSQMASAGQPPEGPSSLGADAGASQPGWGQQQPQQHYGAMLPPPAGASLYPAQHQHSNDAAAYMQMAPQQATATYAVPQPQPAAYPVPASQPSRSATLPQPSAYGTVPQAVPYGMVPQGVPYGSPQPGVAYPLQPPQYAQQPQQQHQQQQPQVLNLRPLPGQSMAEAAMAAIQAQQVWCAMTAGLVCRPFLIRKLMATISDENTRSLRTASPATAQQGTEPRDLGIYRRSCALKLIRYCTHAWRRHRCSNSSGCIRSSRTVWPQANSLTCRQPSRRSRWPREAPRRPA